ncbi:MAG: dihydroorotate dehydrogenase-like protein [Verrucomicrobiae bacterium]|nr:dihydroorotate dehydrogenase-like protein [Verrucomicrobiae bacterium]
MDLTTTYLGMKLRNPLVMSACQPLSEDIGNIKLAEDSGAAAVVLYSLFEEQLRAEAWELHHHTTAGTESYAESLTFFPEPSHYHLGPEGYLKHIQKAKEAVRIPVIASLNGCSLGGWTEFARQIEQAGADALELNIYWIPTDMNLPGSAVEQTYVDIVQAVRNTVKIPISVKLSPRFSNIAHMIKRLDDIGADGFTLFNRFYQPDIDLDCLEVRPKILLSTPQALRLPLRWIAILKGRIRASLAASGGIHTAEDVVKMLLVGADVTMLCSALLKYGIGHISTVERDLRHWLEQHEYESVRQMQGSLSQRGCPDPAAFERAQYLRAVTTYRPA